MMYWEEWKIPKTKFAIFGFWDMVDLICEKSEKYDQNLFFLSDFDEKIFGYDSDDFMKKKFLPSRKKKCFADMLLSANLFPWESST